MSLHSKWSPLEVGPHLMSPTPETKWRPYENVWFAKIGRGIGITHMEDAQIQWHDDYMT